MQELTRRVFLSSIAGAATCVINHTVWAEDKRQAGGDSSEKELIAKWETLTDDEANRIARINIHGLMRAAHAYFDKHGALPPAYIANPKLPGGKQLSGLALLLPHLNADSWIDKGRPCFDEATVKLAKETYDSIDFTKAWDDPANRKAGQTVIPAFLSPRCGAFRDGNGQAVSHFGLVRGSSMGWDGAFPGEKGVTIREIEDGTVSTLGFGEISSDLGPWLAEGIATARQVTFPEKDIVPMFCARDKNTCWFTCCDSSPYLVSYKKLKPEILNAFATRSGQEIGIDLKEFAP